MKKTLIFAAAAAFSCALAFGQGPSVVLQNHENSTFYFVVDPQELAGLAAGSPLMASTVAGYFAAAEDDGTFSALSPQAEARLSGLATGTHLLVGFFEQPDGDEFPVRVLALQADSTRGRAILRGLCKSGSTDCSARRGEARSICQPGSGRRRSGWKNRGKAGRRGKPPSRCRPGAATEARVARGSAGGAVQGSAPGAAEVSSVPVDCIVFSGLRPCGIHAGDPRRFPGASDIGVPVMEADRDTNRLRAGQSSTPRG